MTSIKLHRVWVLVIALGLFGCSKGEAPASPAVEEESAGKAETSEEAPEEPQTLVIYSGRSQLLIEPLIEAFEKKTGIETEVRYDKSTQVLANRIATEGAETEADVFFAQDSGYLGALGKKGLLKPLAKALLGTVPDNYRDAAGNWVGISGRARVLVYDPKKLAPEDLPKYLHDLTDPKWKGKMGWAPGNASFQAHVSALRHTWGEDKTKVWLEGIKANETKIYPKNSPQVKAVSNGEIEIGWVNHYYLHKLKASDPKLQASNHSFAKGDAGNLMMVSGIGVTAASQNEKAATRFIEFLLSVDSQKYLTTKVFEYPANQKVAPNDDLPQIGEAMIRVDQEHLADLGPTLNLLKELKLP
jgi:iron(III) transport system substrate-binding protein